MTILELKKLMIDDFVYSRKHHQIVRVWAVGPGYIQCYVGGLLTEIGNDDVDPIKLTDELLERNGFVLQKESSIAKEYICALGGGPDHNLFVTVFKNRDFVKVYYCPIDVSTMIDENIPHCAVHQLQHALSSCDIEKEITL